MRLYLIRHGKTEANERHCYCGSTDLSLTEGGIEELKKKDYKVPENCRFMTSGMKRTEETLFYLFGNVVHTKNDCFKEIDFGTFEMCSYEQLKDREDYQKWITGDNEKNIPPNGESGEQMRIRVMDGVKKLLEEDQDTVLISHGGVIASIMEQLFPEEGKNRYLWQPKPGSGYVIENGVYQELK